MVLRNDQGGGIKWKSFQTEGSHPEPSTPSVGSRPRTGACGMRESSLSTAGRLVLAGEQPLCARAFRGLQTG